MILNVTDRFPDGTQVRAWLARAHPPCLTTPARGVHLAPPNASASEVGTVANGQVTFTALTPGQTYWAAASVGGTWKQLAFVAA
jgi:hypothetical protein